MYFDLLAGKRLELEAINGAVIRMGRQYGVPTPYNQVVYAGLKPYINGAPTA
jgi:2-dehydropantoate 2-reductase